MVLYDRKQAQYIGLKEYIYYLLFDKQIAVVISRETITSGQPLSN